MSFADKMRNISKAESKISEKKKLSEEELAARMEKIKDEKFKFLTEKYLDTILRGIENAARKGLNEKYINFSRDDFKANCKGLGFPNQFQGKWLDEMKNPESAYLPTLEDGSKPSLEGISFDIWNNSAFTTHFTW
jgi:hypothetical protein